MLPQPGDKEKKISLLSPAKREWALVAAFILYMIFGLSQHAFIRGTTIGPEKMIQVHILSTAGSLLGAFLLPLLLPLGDLRRRQRPQTSGSMRHTRFPWEARLVIVGVLFLPNAIVRLLGSQVWLASSFYSGLMGIGNGVVSILMVGCFYTLVAKNRAFWAAMSQCAGLFIFHLVLGPGRELLLPYMYAFAGITLTLAGVLLLVFLAAAPKEGLPLNKNPSMLSAPHSHSFLFPILAIFVIFWTNSFTDRLLLPTMSIPVSPGFHPSTIAFILGLPLFGFLASLSWRRFQIFFFTFGSILFLLVPSLLLFSHSEILFLVLYTLNLEVIQLIVALFPIIIVDLYWQDKPASGYWVWLVAASTTLIHVNALIPAGLFSSLSIDNNYAVVLLILAAVAFFLLSRKIIAKLPGAAMPEAIPVVSRADNFRVHGLTEREIMAAELILQGLENDEIKEKMFVSLSSVKMYVGSILKKYNLKRRTEFIAMFIRE